MLPQIVGRDALLAANSFFQSTIIIVGVAGTAAAGVIAGISDSLALAFVIDAAPPGLGSDSCQDCDPRTPIDLESEKWR